MFSYRSHASDFRNTPCAVVYRPQTRVGYHCFDVYFVAVNTLRAADRKPVCLPRRGVDAKFGGDAGVGCNVRLLLPTNVAVWFDESTQELSISATSRCWFLRARSNGVS